MRKLEFCSRVGTIPMRPVPNDNVVVLPVGLALVLVDRVPAQRIAVFVELD